MTCLLTPHDLGLPAHFSTFRHGQGEAIDTVVTCDQPFVTGAYPTGSGKSVVAVGSALMNGGRTVIYTSTKALAEQYLDDFSSIGMTEMRGQSNFQCLESRRTCADGKNRCNARKSGECPYLQARNRFLGSNLAVTNYDYGLSSNLYGDGIGEVDLLVLDEAHSAVQQLSDALTIEFNHHDYHQLYLIVGDPPKAVPDITAWKSWGAQAAKRLAERLKELGDDHTHHPPHAERFKGTLARLNEVDETWVFEHPESKFSRFSPLWPTKYAKKVLFAGAKKVLLISATIVPKTLTLLDVQPEESLFLHQSYSFPAHRCPVYLYGTVQIDYRTDASGWAVTMGRMDTLTGMRLDRKGITHSISYEKQDYIKNNSAYSDLMLAPKSNALIREIQLFKNSPPPMQLVSPAITTGYNFPYGQCEYSHIIKVPFVDTRGAIMKSRAEQDPEYPPYLMAQNLTQMCGRPMRANDDQNETFIHDRHAEWIFKPPVPPGTTSKYRTRGGYRHLFAPWFLQLIRYANSGPPPVPPPPLSTTAPR